MTKRTDRKKARAEKARREKEKRRKKGPRIPRVFSAKARKGDAAEVKFRFSGIVVPVEDPDDPSDGLKEKTKAAKALPKSKEVH